MVNNGVKDEVLVSVWVTVGVHLLCNEVSTELNLIAVIKANDIFPGV